MCNIMNTEYGGQTCIHTADALYVKMEATPPARGLLAVVGSRWAKSPRRAFGCCVFVEGEEFRAS